MHPVLALAATTIVTMDRRGTGPELVVAFQGVANAYSDLAGRKYLDDLQVGGRLAGCRSFAAALAQLSDGRADLAILPIENTTAGSINQVYDLLLEADVAIVGEETWKVDHCLAGPVDVPLSTLRRVLSHPQGLEQCANFLQSLPDVEPVAYFDTAEALRRVAELADPASAAIGSPQAAAAYGLVVLRTNIANQEENHTRFVVVARARQRPAAILGREPAAGTLRKTSLILAVRHERGALLRALEVLAAHGLSMTKLESRPRPGRPWEYLFFIDFEGDAEDPAAAVAVRQLAPVSVFVKVLGSYPVKALARSG